MSRSIDITGHLTMHQAMRVADLEAMLIDGTTSPPSILLKGGRRATIGDTLTRHDDGTVTVEKTTQEVLF